MWWALEARHIPEALGQSRDEQKIRDTQTFTWGHKYSPGAISTCWFRKELLCPWSFSIKAASIITAFSPAFLLLLSPIYILKKRWHRLIVGISLAKCSVESSPCLGEPGWLVLHGGSCYSSLSYAQSQKDNKSKMTFLTSSGLIQIILVNWTYELTWANHCIKVLASRPWPTHNLIKKHWFVVKI